MEKITLDLRLAGYGSRLIATIIDTICTVLVVAYVLQGSIVVATYRDLGFANCCTGLSTWFFVVGIIWGLGALTVFAFQIYFVSRYAQTIGKRVMKIYVVHRKTNTQCTFCRYFGARVMPLFVLVLLGVFGFLSVWVVMIIFLLNSLMIFLSGRRCLHDWIADTVVIKK